MSEPEIEPKQREWKENRRGSESQGKREGDGGEESRREKEWRRRGRENKRRNRRPQEGPANLHAKPHSLTAPEPDVSGQWNIIGSTPAGLWSLRSNDFSDSGIIATRNHCYLDKHFRTIKFHSTLEKPAPYLERLTHACPHYPCLSQTVAQHLVRSNVTASSRRCPQMAPPDNVPRLPSTFPVANVSL